MKLKSSWGLILLAVGFVIVVVGATADVTGLGGHPGFGPQQISMIVVGAFIGVAGVVLWLWKRER